MEPDDNWSITYNRIRDVVIFTIGCIGMIYELFVVDDPRLYALVAISALLGLPLMLQADERNNGHG